MKKLFGSPFFEWSLRCIGILTALNTATIKKRRDYEFFWANSDADYCQRDDIRIFEVEENTEYVHERVVVVAHDISVLHRLPSRNPGWRPIIQTKIRVKTLRRNTTHSLKNIIVTMLHYCGNTLHEPIPCAPMLNNFLFPKKTVSTMSDFNGRNNFFLWSSKQDSNIDDSVCKEVGPFRWLTLQNVRPHVNTQKNKWNL